MAAISNYPVVRIAVNEHLRRVAQRSTYRFDFAGVVDNSMKIIDEPVVVDYAGEGGSAFTLPPSGFVSIGQSGGWVYDVTIALPKSSGPLVAAYATAATIDTVLSHTGWRRTGGALPGLEQIQRDLGNPVPGFGGNHGLGAWRFGTAELVMALKRTAERGERTAVPGRRVTVDLYLVEVEIYDGARLDSYEKRTYNIRRARRQGDADQPLPLEAVLDDPMPVPILAPASKAPR